MSGISTVAGIPVVACIAMFLLPLLLLLLYLLLMLLSLLLPLLPLVLYSSFSAIFMHPCWHGIHAKAGITVTGVPSVAGITLLLKSLL